MSVPAVPPGYHTVSPYLMVQGVAAFLGFLTEAFDAQITERLESPDGLVMHGEVRIGDSLIMMGEAREGWPAMPSALYLYVDDCDAWFRRAVSAGADVVEEPTDQFYGDRSAGVRDGWGNLWFLATHQEDVSSEELKRRFAELS